ncbi:hypothetical protein DXT91_28575 [Agrobacterium tumefaciens]|nr:hypothetical protein [Agrobacterium tumefaciens]
MASVQADDPSFPAVLYQRAAGECSGPMFAGVGIMATEAGLSEASPLRGVREMAAAVFCVSD